jgi:hypothetical protein
MAYRKNPVMVLASETGIDLKSIAATNMFTVPTGKVLVVTQVNVRITASDTPSVVAQVSFGKSANYNEFAGTTTMTTVDQVGEYMPLIKTNSNTTYFVAGDVMGLKVQVGATATTLTGACEMLGYLLDA